MCKIIDDIVQRERNETKAETVRRMIVKNKYAIEEIAEMSGLSVDEVKELMQKHPA